jgi:hypothetical protein
MLELLTMKSQWRRDMERMLAERAAKEDSKSDESCTEEEDSDSSNCDDRFSNTVLEICI